MFNYDELTKTLTIQFEFDDELVDLSNNIKIIIFENTYSNCSKFNKNVDNLPPNLTHLTFGSYFNQNVDKLPPNLTHLTFEGRFNQKLNCLPRNLTHLTFGWIFDKDKCPSNLTYSIHNGIFNQDVDNLPQNLTHLTFGNNFNQNINNLPFTIQKIIIHDKNKIHLFKKIPYGCILTDVCDMELCNFCF